MSAQQTCVWVGKNLPSVHLRSGLFIYRIYTYNNKKIETNRNFFCEIYLVLDLFLKTHIGD